MTKRANWLQLPVNYPLGYPQKISTTIDGYGFDLIWSLNYQTEFRNSENEFSVHLKVLNQFDQTIVFNGVLQEGNYYTAKSPFYGRSWFVIYPMKLVPGNMDVRVMPTVWIRDGFYLVEN